MKIKLIMTNLKNAIKEHKSIYTLIFVSQVIAIVGVLFLYGVFGSYLVRLDELDIDSYEIGASFDNSKIGELQQIFPKELSELENIDYVFVGGMYNGDTFSAHFEYENGKLYQSSEVNGNLKLQEGRLLSNDDYKNKSNVTYSSNGDNVSDIITIGDEQFEVVGIDEKKTHGYEVPFTASIDNINLIAVIVNFKQLPQQKDYILLRDLWQDTFGNRVEVDEFEIKDESEIIAIRTVLAIALVVGIISALNVCLLFGYIISRRKKQMAIYGIIGVSKKKRLLINQVEILTVTTFSLCVGIIFFELIIRGCIEKIYDNICNLYGVKLYGISFAIYFICVFIVTNIMLHFVNSSNLADLLRRSKGD